jgi:hypothetical protein
MGGFDFDVYSPGKPYRPSTPELDPAHPTRAMALAGRAQRASLSLAEQLELAETTLQEHDHSLLHSPAGVVSAPTVGGGRPHWVAAPWMHDYPRLVKEAYQEQHPVQLDIVEQVQRRLRAASYTMGGQAAAARIHGLPRFSKIGRADFVRTIRRIAKVGATDFEPRARVQTASDAQLQWLFDQLDADHDGAVSYMELVHFVWGGDAGEPFVWGGAESCVKAAAGKRTAAVAAGKPPNAGSPAAAAAAAAATAEKLRRVRRKLRAMSYTSGGMDLTRVFEAHTGVGERDGGGEDGGARGRGVGGKGGGLSLRGWRRLLRVSARLTPAELSERELQRLFRTVDQHGHGSISRAEFCEFVQDGPEHQQLPSSSSAERRPAAAGAGRVGTKVGAAAASVGGAGNSTAVPEAAVKSPTSLRFAMRSAQPRRDPAWLTKARAKQRRFEKYCAQKQQQQQQQCRRQQHEQQQQQSREDRGALPGGDEEARREGATVSDAMNTGEEIGHGHSTEAIAAMAAAAVGDATTQEPVEAAAAAAAGPPPPGMATPTQPLPPTGTVVPAEDELGTMLTQQSPAATAALLFSRRLVAAATPVIPAQLCGCTDDGAAAATADGVATPELSLLERLAEAAEEYALAGMADVVVGTAEMVAAEEDEVDEVTQAAKALAQALQTAQGEVAAAQAKSAAAQEEKAEALASATVKVHAVEAQAEEAVAAAERRSMQAAEARAAEAAEARGRLTEEAALAAARREAEAEAERRLLQQQAERARHEAEAQHAAAVAAMQEQVAREVAQAEAARVELLEVREAAAADEQDLLAQQLTLEEQLEDALARARASRSREDEEAARALLSREVDDAVRQQRAELTTEHAASASQLTEELSLAKEALAEAQEEIALAQEEAALAQEEAEVEKAEAAQSARSLSEAEEKLAAATATAATAAAQAQERVDHYRAGASEAHAAAMEKLVGEQRAIQEAATVELAVAQEQAALSDTRAAVVQESAQKAVEEVKEQLQQAFAARREASAAAAAAEADAAAAQQQLAAHAASTEQRMVEHAEQATAAKQQLASEAQQAAAAAAAALREVQAQAAQSERARDRLAREMAEMQASQQQTLSQAEQEVVIVNAQQQQEYETEIAAQAAAHKEALGIAGEQVRTMQARLSAAEEHLAVLTQSTSAVEQDAQNAAECRADQSLMKAPTLKSRMAAILQRQTAPASTEAKVEKTNMEGNAKADDDDFELDGLARTQAGDDLRDPSSVLEAANEMTARLRDRMRLLTTDEVRQQQNEHRAKPELDDAEAQERTSPRAGLRDAEGYTPLMRASLSGELEIVRRLLSGAHVNVNLRCTSSPTWQDAGRSALHMAAAQGHVRVLSALLDAEVRSLYIVVCAQHIG